MGAVIDINGHKIAIIDGTPTQGIGQLGPFAVHWNNPNGIVTRLEVAPVGEFYGDAYHSLLWEVTQDRTTGHTRWVKIHRDEP